MQYRLREDLYYCIAGGRTVFLDVQENRYFCLPRASDTVFQALCAGRSLSISDHDALRPLVAKRLISIDPIGNSLPSAIAMERPTVVPRVSSGANPSLRIVARAIAAQFSSALSLRTRTLVSIRQSIARRKWQSQECEAAEAAADIYTDIGLAFARTTLLFRPADRCLPRSLAFLAVCHAYKLCPSIVFGVRTNPFVAHCWIQSGDRLLHDDSGEAQLFTPIMAI